MKKKVLSVIVLIAVFAFAFPTPNAHAIWWLFGCNSTTELLYSTGHYVDVVTYVRHEGKPGFFNHSYDSLGIDANGNWYWIEKVVTQVWQEYPIENCAGNR